ncbi:putative sporulation protein YtxC [Aquibacillus halophilus]|uniref:Putative sporulation protein YtxC n=1 Tax=Aquibacillus halophilus TaxID=930132 RepID=A0A6A8DBC3_9BACI|nr:sporulation protein YtxC [Aquibacillus halophilus]MRH42898.1 putative sporulation protein YtxC [Aquibacillus halophilus]
MFEVYFESNKEAVTFCQRLFQYDKYFIIHWKTNDEWGNQIKIEVTNSVANQPQVIARAMTDVFINHREINWVKQMVTNNYYYKNKEEIYRIIELAQSIISGSDFELNKVVKSKPRNTLFNLFQTYTSENIVHYDSIVNFRFQSYRNELMDVIGLAIDEYKREEEYQSFIESLREYVSRKGTYYSTVHVIQGHNFRYYQSDGNPFSNSELIEMIKKEPLYIVGLDEEELNLTPLLTMAPKEIIIYGNNPSEAKTLTIINIFQEKVKFKPLKKFPYPIFLKTKS